MSKRESFVDAADAAEKGEGEQQQQQQQRRQPEAAPKGNGRSLKRSLTIEFDTCSRWCGLKKFCMLGLLQLLVFALEVVVLLKPGEMSEFRRLYNERGGAGKNATEEFAAAACVCPP